MVTIHFHYDREYGLVVEPDEDHELTAEQAMIVAVNNLARGMNLLADALSKFQAEFRLYMPIEKPKRVRARAAKTNPKKVPRKKTAKKR